MTFMTNLYEIMGYQRRGDFYIFLFVCVLEFPLRLVISTYTINPPFIHASSSGLVEEAGEGAGENAVTSQVDPTSNSDAVSTSEDSRFVVLRDCKQHLPFVAFRYQPFAVIDFF